MVPEGANALVLRGGRYYKTLTSGVHLVPPYYPVSHLFTRRVIPFDVREYVSPTANNVPMTVDMLVMFSIGDPYRFVYRISADHFDRCSPRRVRMRCASLFDPFRDSRWPT